MGEYAEMMLDGTCCSSCGEFLDIDGLATGAFEPQGFPSLCASCRREGKREARIPRFNKANIKPNAPKPGQIACPKCKRAVREHGFAQHCQDAHGIKVNDLLIKELSKCSTS